MQVPIYSPGFKACVNKQEEYWGIESLESADKQKLVLYSIFLKRQSFYKLKWKVFHDKWKEQDAEGSVCSVCV